MRPSLISSPLLSGCGRHEGIPLFRIIFESIATAPALKLGEGNLNLLQNNFHARLVGDLYSPGTSVPQGRVPRQPGSWPRLARSCDHLLASPSFRLVIADILERFIGRAPGVPAAVWRSQWEATFHYLARHPERVGP